MGERYDVMVALGDGVFPLVAVAEGKTGRRWPWSAPAPGPAPRADRAPGRARPARSLLGTDADALPRPSG